MNRDRGRARPGAVNAGPGAEQPVAAVYVKHTQFDAGPEAIPAAMRDAPRWLLWRPPARNGGGTKRSGEGRGGEGGRTRGGAGT